MQIKTGADLMVALLLSEGVDRVFGNPGSTELALVDAVARCPDINYILGLHECCVIPMADGYAQATGRPSFVNLHTMSGLGNAVGTLANAKANGTPMVVTAGQQDRALLAHSPLLGYDLTAIAGPVVKWADEVRSEAELGPVLRRAFIQAAAQPSGPIFVSIPHDILLSPATSELPERSRILPAGIAAGLDDMAELLTTAKAPAIIVGQEASSIEANKAIIALAEILNAPIFGAFNMQRAVVSPDHPLWHGDLPGLTGAIAETLVGFDCVFHAGGQAFQLFAGETGRVLDQKCRFLHLAPEPSQLGRSFTTTLGAYGDLAASLANLAKLVRAMCPSQPAIQQHSISPPSHRGNKLDLETSCQIVIDAMPANAVLHNEIPSIGPHLRSLFNWTTPDQFYSSKQSVGWAMGAAVGVCLGHERKRWSVVLVGDGSAAFSMAALWSAARHKLPVIFVILDNGGYQILETISQMVMGTKTNRTSSFCIDPPLDFSAISEGFGVAAVAVDTTKNLENALQNALSESGPTLIHVRLSPSQTSNPHLSQ